MNAKTKKITLDIETAEEIKRLIRISEECYGEFVKAVALSCRARTDAEKAEYDAIAHAKCHEAMGIRFDVFHALTHGELSDFNRNVPLD